MKSFITSVYFFFNPGDDLLRWSDNIPFGRFPGFQGYNELKKTQQHLIVLTREHMHLANGDLNMTFDMTLDDHINVVNAISVSDASNQLVRLQSIQTCLNSTIFVIFKSVDKFWALANVDLYAWVMYHCM